MNARVALTPHSSSSACGTAGAAAAVLSSAAASPFSGAAARESSLRALCGAEAATDYMSLAGVLNATPTAAAPGRTTSSKEEAFSPTNTSRGATAITELSSSIVRSNLFYNAAEWIALQQQQQQNDGQQRHLEGQQLQQWGAKEDAVERILDASYLSPGVCSSSVSCRNEGRRRERQNTVSSVACSIVGGESTAAIVKERLTAGRGECNDGSDCSTRSCATGVLLQKKATAESSSDETRFCRKSSGIGSSYSRSTATGEDEQSFPRSRCSISGVQRDQQRHLVEEGGYCSCCSNNVQGFKSKGFAAESGGCVHARQLSRSRRRDTRTHSRRRQKERDDSGKQRQQESSNSGDRYGGRREVQVAESRIATACHIPKEYSEGGERKKHYFRVLKREDSAAEEDAVPEDASIVAPAFLTSRCNTRRVVGADVAAPTAKPAFRAASAVSAVVVAEAAALGHKGGTRTAAASPPASLPLTTAAAGGCWFDAFSTTGFVGGSFSVAKKGEAVVGEDVAPAVIEALPPHFGRGHDSSPSFHEKSLRAKELVGGGGDVETGRVALTAACYSGKEQELRYGSTVGLLSVHAGVDLSSAAGDCDLRRCSTAVAGNNNRRDCEEKSGGEEESGESGVAARREEALCRGMSAAAAARRGGGFITASVSNGGGTGLRIAASTAALQVGAAAAAADRTHRYYHREDTSGIDRVLSSSSAQGRTSSRGSRRAVAAIDAGVGEGTPGKNEAKDLAMPNSGVKKGTAESEAAAAAHILCDGDAASAPALGRELFFDLKCRPPGVVAGGGGPGGNSRCGSSSSVRDGTEMAAGSDRGGRPGGLTLCPASGGDEGGGGDTKTATGCVGAPRGNDFRYNSRNAGTANMPRATTVMNRPTRVEAGRQKFLILDSPSDENLPAYIQEMKAFNVAHLVRTCEATYDDALVRESGICTHEWIFPDGEPPPEEVIDEWLALCNSVSSQQRAAAIAVHCVAGLGRAPVLVAVALIEKGMDPMDAIMFIRERRKGAINRRQLQFLKSYRRRSHMQRCCIKGCSIM